MAWITDMISLHDRDVVFDAARSEVLRLGYELDLAKPESGELRFRSGLSWLSWAGQEITFQIDQAPVGGTILSASGKPNQGLFPQLIH